MNFNKLTAVDNHNYKNNKIFTKILINLLIFFNKINKINKIYIKLKINI
jgi:hypothetical protein